MEKMKKQTQNYVCAKLAFSDESSLTVYVRSVSSKPVAHIRCSASPFGGSGELRHVCINALPASLVIIGCSFRVANVYTWPVSLATRSITCVPVSVDNS